ncbi:MAG: transketolase [Myxococcota bacterium]
MGAGVAVLPRVRGLRAQTPYPFVVPDLQGREALRSPSTRSPEANDTLPVAARSLRILAIDAVARAGHTGHVGLPLGCAEIGAVLFGEQLRHDPAAPEWPDRDRFVLSAGHGSMLLYGLLHLSGYPVTLDDLRSFRQLGSRTPGHPEHGALPGIETTTGPLGQGFANAVGMALAERMLAARFGPALVDHRTWVLASDGDLMEGVASEAASLAGHLGLGRLIVIYDDNGITIDGPTRLTFTESVPARFEAYGWETQRVDGHDPRALRAAYARACESDERPHLIACRTHIGAGSPVADSARAHGQLDSELTERTREALGWTRPPFEVPAEARAFFQPNAARGAELRASWDERLERALADPGTARLWAQTFGRELPRDLDEQLPHFEREEPLATRQASRRVINALSEAIPSLVGGSADLTSSNGTQIGDDATLERGKFDGRNIHFGVREHAMAAIANGLMLHGGVRPFIGTFLVFSDYMRPAVRLAALMRQPVTFVFTHDSIFVGEDGPTHQPVEQVASLRAIPGLEVWRPADARETLTAWRSSLLRDSGPTALVLTRQAVPVLGAERVEIDARRGGYVLAPERDATSGPDLVLVGSGSEVTPLLEAQVQLADEGHQVRVVSVPCLEIFLAQDPAYRDRVLPTPTPRLVVEAGVRMGMSPLLRPGDRFHGMDRFGASAPSGVLAREFGFTGGQIADLARSMLG